MKKNVLIFALVICLCLVLPVQAMAEEDSVPRYTYITNATANCYIPSNGFSELNAVLRTNSDITKVKIVANLMRLEGSTWYNVFSETVESNSNMATYYNRVYVEKGYPYKLVTQNYVYIGSSLKEIATATSPIASF